MVVSLEVGDLTEHELRQEILTLRRRVEKLAALLRLALALLHTSGFTLSGERLPDGHAKLRICAPWTGHTRVSRYERSSGSCVCRRVGFRCIRRSQRWGSARRELTRCGISTPPSCLRDGTHASLHAVIDNFSRRILAWRVADTFAPVNSVAVLLAASQGATPSETTPVVLADAGVENVNAQVDDLVTTGVLRRVLAFTELKFSNSMIEAWWRSLTHQWLFLHALDRVATSDGWWRSTSTTTTASFRIRRFWDRRRTRCTSAPGTECRRT
jgi:hypothetical protein